MLGTTDEWHLTAGINGGHVFHIHVNPFQVIDILDPKGVSIYDSSGHCTAAELATGDQPGTAPYMTYSSIRYS